MFAAATSSPAFIQRSNPVFAKDVADGLTRAGQKTLPASWLYDDIGSALFEVITLLPEYGLTRADGALLQSTAGEIVRAAGEPTTVVELGSGTGSKTRHVLEAAARRRRIEYRPVDISPAALAACESALGTMKNVRTAPIEATYLEGIDLALEARGPGKRALILFLGSTIGNFTRSEASTFLQKIRQRILPGDCLLLGADLVKPIATLIRAYDDSLGVTAAFNLNLLARINRELGGHFDLAQFAHEARYNERQSRIEMHLRSRIRQDVSIDQLDLTVSFATGETIWTESSHKFRAEEICALGERAGWLTARQWLDREWGFAETLFIAR
jgi:L-histidine N-alpha-methyltransferase